MFRIQERIEAGGSEDGAALAARATATIAVSSLTLVNDLLGNLTLPFLDLVLPILVSCLLARLLVQLLHAYAAVIGMHHDLAIVVRHRRFHRRQYVAVHGAQVTLRHLLVKLIGPAHGILVGVGPR